MKISIIVPVYNVADYVQKCVESVLSQTYANIELIIIDDCGEDNSIQIVKTLLDRSSLKIPYTVLTHEINKGLSAARNTGINNSMGDYLFFLDSDDMIEENCISQMVKCINKYPDCDIVQAGAKVNSLKFNWLNYQTWTFDGDYSDNTEWITHIMLKRLNCIPVTVWNKLIKKNFIIDNKLFFCEGITHEDELWTFQAARCIKNIAFCRFNTYHYNIREGSITTRESELEKAKSWFVIFEKMIDTLLPGENSIFTQWIQKHLYTQFCFLDLDWVKKEQTKLIQKLKKKTLKL